MLMFLFSSTKSPRNAMGIMTRCRCTGKYLLLPMLVATHAGHYQWIYILWTNDTLNYIYDEDN